MVVNVVIRSTGLSRVGWAAIDARLSAVCDCSGRFSSPAFWLMGNSTEAFSSVQDIKKKSTFVDRKTAEDRQRGKG
jgi:hypothetical protein